LAFGEPFPIFPRERIVKPPLQVRFAPIVLKKSFLGDGRKFLGPLMRFVRGDLGDHIFSHENYHGLSYRRYGALQRWKSLKISFREIFGIVRFSTFATKSAQNRLCVPKTSSNTPEFAGLRWLAWRRLVSSSSPSATIPSRTALSRDFALS